jgi:hypothetical protein
MDAILLGVAIGAGAVLVLKRSKLAVRGALGWTARTAGKISGQVVASIDATKRHVRDQYSKGRDASLERMNEIAPTSTRPNGKSMPPLPPAN